MATTGQRRSRTKARTVAKPRRARVPSARGPHSLPPKLTPPQPARLYPRTRLFKLLDHLRADHRVIWVSAPGGAGKTSLAASYLAAHKRPVLWYQVDSGDGDIASFFYYMGLAAKQAAPRHKRPLPLLTPEYLGDVPTFTRNFFRELYRRLPRNSTIVLDNYQDAPDDSPLHEVLHTAMREVPEGLNLLVLSRVEPPAVLARLRLCDHAACLDWDKIQLTREETAGLARLRTGHDQPDTRTVDTLYASTQGWAAGVVLMLEQSLGGEALDSNPPTSQKLLFDYFAEEILNRSAPPVREFLLKTSLFPTISIDAARALTGLDQSRNILDDLTRRNYFTVRHTGPGGDTYQYHPLFREFLQKAADSDYSPDGLARLRTQAGEILIGAGQVNEGVALLIAAQAWPLLAQQIQKQASAQLANGRWQTVGQWISVLPTADVEINPWLLFWRANATMPRDLFVARADFRRAYLLFKESNDPVGIYLAWSGAVDTFMYLWVDFAPLDYWIDEMEVLRRRFPDYPSLEIDARVTCGMVGAALWRRADMPMMRDWASAGMLLLDKPIDPTIKLMIGYLLLLYLVWWQGNLSKAQVVFAKIRPLGENPRATILTKLMWKVMEAAYLYLVGQVDSAITAAHEGLDLATESGVHHSDLLLYAQAASAYLTKFDVDGSYRELRGMESLLRDTETFDFAHYHYIMCWTLLADSKPSIALGHIRKGMEVIDRVGASNYPYFGAVTLAQTLYECGDVEEAFAVLEPTRDWGQRVGSTYMEVQYHLMHALRSLDQLDEKGCTASLTSALTVGEENGLPLIPWFGLRKPLLTRLLHYALVHDIKPEYVRYVIRLRQLTPPDHAAGIDAWPYPLKLYTLGRFAVVLDDKLLPRSPGHKKPLELLQALVALGGRAVDEDMLAETLWPDAEGDAAHQALKVNVHRLRKLLPNGTIIWSEGKLSLDAHQTWVDFWAMERELGCLDQSTPADAPEQAARVDRVLRLYRGEFLIENTAPWALAARERLRNKTLRVVTRAAETIRQRDPAAAVPIYEKAIEIDPLREHLYQDLMRCHQQLRQSAEGLHIYRRCRDTLKRELSLAPAPATEALHQSLKTGQ